MAFRFVKFILSSVLAVASVQAVPDADGWVPVERPERYIEEFSEDEAGVWVVFCKEVEGEKFMVRFPEDPSYKYFPGGIAIDAEKEGDSFHLQVEKRSEEAPEAYFDRKIQEVSALPETFLVKVKRSEGERLDLLYHSNGRWVWERILSTPNSLYSFRTVSDRMVGDTHRQFISSLDVLPL